MMDEIYAVTETMANFFQIDAQNKVSGEKYNKYSYPLMVEFIDRFYDNEMKADSQPQPVIIMERCIFDEYYVFGHVQKDMGYIIRFGHR